MNYITWMMFLIFFISSTVFAEAYLEPSFQPYDECRPYTCHKMKRHHKHHWDNPRFSAFAPRPKQSWHAHITSLRKGHYNPDMTTGDDNSSIYPEMNIDQ